MANPYKSYLAIGEKIDKDKNILAAFHLQSEGEPFNQTAGGVAAESSVGTWTDISLQAKTMWDRLHAKVAEMDEGSGQLIIAYPLELFEYGNLPQLLSSIAGNIFGLSEISALRLNDIEFPEVYVKAFPGPYHGIEGIRKFTKIEKRPLLGSIIKPKLGLSSKNHMEATIEVYDGGVDLVKDDENLTSQSFNLFYERVDEITGKMKEKGYLGKDGEKIYAFNITASYEEMLKRAEYVDEKGGNCQMIDILTAGFSGVCAIRNRNFGKIIHAHRAMHAAFTRSRQYGISMLVIAKLARLAGVDSLHTGTIVGKMEGGKKEVLAINKFLRSEWYGLKPVLPVASGGLHPGNIPSLVELLGPDMLFNFGGGIHGHPDGSLAGSRACCQALEATEEGVALEEYAKTHQELAKALEKWG
nr:RuBisCO long chain, Form III-c [uncultured bacterium]